MNDQLVEKGLSLVDQMIAGLKDVAPQMADLTLAAVRVQAYFDLFVASVWGLITIATFVVGIRVIRWLYKGGLGARDFFPYGIGMVSTMVVMLPVPIIFLSNLFNSYMWAALFDPRISLAMRALDKVLSATNTK